MSVQSVAEQARFRIRKNEDGETVIRLAGKVNGAWPSDQPHAGLWGKARWYLYAPCNRPKPRIRKALALHPEVEDHSGDAEILLVGPKAAILDLLQHGPAWSKARTKRTQTPDQKLASAERLGKHRFKARP